MSWIQAVKEFAKTKEGGKFAIPRKDTPEYEEVKKIQARMAVPVAKEEVKPKTIRKIKIKAVVPEAKPQEAQEAPVAKKVAKAKAKAPKEVEVAMVVTEEKVKRKRVAKKKEEAPAPEPAPAPPAPKGIQLISHGSVVGFQ